MEFDRTSSAECRHDCKAAKAPRQRTFVKKVLIYFRKMLRPLAPLPAHTVVILVTTCARTSFSSSPSLAFCRLRMAKIVAVWARYHVRQSAARKQSVLWDPRRSTKGQRFRRRETIRCFSFYWPWMTDACSTKVITMNPVVTKTVTFWSATSMFGGQRSLSEYYNC